MRKPFGTEIFPFGRNSAEQEGSALLDVFFQTDYAQKALSNDVTLVVGRRGSGKTALRTYLQQSTEIHFDSIVDINKSGMLTEMLREVSQAEKESRSFTTDSLAQLWESAMWIQIMQKLVDDPIFKTNPKCDIVREKLTELGVMKETKIFSVIKELLSNAGKLIGKKGEVLANSLIRFSEIVGSHSFEEAKQGILSHLQEGHSILVVIDTMEEYRVRAPEVDRALGGLLQATTFFAGPYPHPNFHLKCFLPGEVYPYITKCGVVNIRKVGERPVLLTWKPKELEKMLCRRLAKWLSDHFPNLKSEFDHINWNNYKEVHQRVWLSCFPEDITNRVKKQESSFAYIARHTQMHPGQTIWICNLIAQRSYERDLFPMEISKTDIVDVIREKEDDIATEILGSYKNVYPDIDLILTAFDEMPNVFPASDLGEIAKRSGKHWKDARMKFNEDLFTRMALECGFIGRVKDETPIYYIAEFEYHLNDEIVLSPKDKCAIHPLFYKKYRIVTVDSKTVYPHILTDDAVSSKGNGA